ncbi:TPA: hypothetical protein HMM06_16015 [Escherichia coli]|nr:hypothetical protein [Escherichia coli]RSC60611.1 hypothetical protein EGW07_02445 [Citrobacter amalonaticus]HAT7525128.1 hypothetical protein [Citrobacter koseri]HBV3397802.1 hypothetical protein [Klebsiella pneumoniae]HBW8903343.1 hypothetical protein [Klebsiella quasipneumoniae subsp. quasipneumoniae]
MENSDQNFSYQSTVVTESIENDDNDYLSCATLVTNVVESNDNDFHSIHDDALVSHVHLIN